MTIPWKQLDVLEEMLIDLIGQIQRDARGPAAIDGRPPNPCWEEAVIEVVTAARPRERRRYVGLLAQFFRDLDLQQSSVVPDLASYRQSVHQLVNLRLVRNIFQQD